MLLPLLLLPLPRRPGEIADICKAPPLSALLPPPLRDPPPYTEHAMPQQQYTQVRKTAPATSTPAAAEAGAARKPTNSGAARAHDSTGVGAGVGQAVPTTQPV
jgi:hypothetical protein